MHRGPLCGNVGLTRHGSAQLRAWTRCREEHRATVPTVSAQGTIDSRFAPVREAFADLLDRQTGRVPQSQRGTTASGSWTCGAVGPTRPALGRGETTASSCPIRSASRSPRSAHCCSSTAAGSISMRRCSGTGPSSGLRRPCGRCSRTRPASSCSTSPPQPRFSTTGSSCARCWRNRNPPGCRGRHTASRPCSTGTSWASSCGASTAVRPDASSGRRSPARFAWTSRSVSTRATNRAPSS